MLLFVWIQIVCAEDILVKGDLKYLGWQKATGFETCDGSLVPIGGGRVEKTLDRCVPPLPAPAPPAPLQDIHFDFDRYWIRPGDAEILKRNLEWFKANPGVRVSIEGHADQRGSAKHNMVLGEKRAKAAKDYLISLGVSADLVQTMSYGDLKPNYPGRDEEAWAMNRRVRFVPMR